MLGSDVVAQSKPDQTQLHAVTRNPVEIEQFRTTRISVAVEQLENQGAGTVPWTSPLLIPRSASVRVQSVCIELD